MTVIERLRAALDEGPDYEAVPWRREHIRALLAVADAADWYRQRLDGPPGPEGPYEAWRTVCFALDALEALP